MYRVELEMKDTTEIITSASFNLDLLLSIGRDSQLSLPFTKNEMISISTSQIIRSLVVVLNLCQLRAFLSLSLYDTLGLAPHINVSSWGPGDFPVSYWNRDTPQNAWNRRPRSFVIDTELLFTNMRYPYHEC